jgi:hypothetical protein
MKKIIELVSWLYKGLIYLYPAQYRADFGDELAGVFTCMINDSAQEGPFALFKTCLRELWDLPGNIAWAHIRSLRGAGHMKIWMNSQPVQFSLRSGAGIGASFLAFNLLALLGSKLLGGENFVGTMFSTYVILFAFIMLFALVFGIVMAFAFRNLRYTKYFVLLGITWFLLPHVLDFLFPNTWGKLSLEITNVVIYAINGALLGACLNPWRSDTRKFFQFALAGWVGLPLARVLASWLLKPIYAFMGISSSQQPILNIVSALTASVYWAVVGLLLGALLGIFVQWLTSRDEARAVA